MSLQATTVVTFNDGSSDAEYVFNLALDDTLNLDSAGEVKSSFSPEDLIYLQVNKSANVDIKEVAVTAGVITKLRNDSRSNSVTNLFVSRPDTDSEEFVLEHIPESASVSYIGNKGAVEKSVTAIEQFKYTPDMKKTPFIAKFDYEYEITSYRWSPPAIDLQDEETFDMAIVFYINVR